MCVCVFNLKITTGVSEGMFFDSYTIGIDAATIESITEYSDAIYIGMIAVINTSQVFGSESFRWVVAISRSHRYSLTSTSPVDSASISGAIHVSPQFAPRV
jgi:hypothetical protein